MPSSLRCLCWWWGPGGWQCLVWWEQPSEALPSLRMRGWRTYPKRDHKVALNILQRRFFLPDTLTEHLQWKRNCSGFICMKCSTGNTYTFRSIAAGEQICQQLALSGSPHQPRSWMTAGLVRKGCWGSEHHRYYFPSYYLYRQKTFTFSIFSVSTLLGFLYTFNR